MCVEDKRNYITAQLCTLVQKKKVRDKVGVLNITFSSLNC